MQFAEYSASMINIAHAVRDEFTEKFKAAVASNDPIAYSAELGFANKPEDIDPALGYAPRMPIKFLYKTDGALKVVSDYLPYFAGLSNCYEIGVGVGYLLKALIDVEGIDARGCDVEIEKRGVYRVMRNRLSIAGRVEEQWIFARTPIRLPAGTEAVTTFMSVFDKDWGIPEYQWFVDDLRHNGVKKLLWRPNRNEPEIRAFFSSIGAIFPFAGDDNRFFVVTL